MIDPGGSHENVSIQRNTNYCDLETRGPWPQSQRLVPRAWDQRCHLLQLKSEVQRAGSVRSQASQGNRERTREAQTDVCRSGLRKSGAEGSARKKALTPSDKWAAVKTMNEVHGVSVVRSCAAVALARAAYYRAPVDWAIREAPVIEALNELVEAHPRWGVWKYIKRLQALGHAWNHKRIYRIYCHLGLNHPRRTKRRLPTRPSLPVFVPEGPNEVWSADFMSDALSHGTRFRTFNILDDFNREVLAIEVDTSLRAERVIRVLDRLKADRELPHMIRVDNGPEFLAQNLLEWGKANSGADLSYSTRSAHAECLY